MISYFTLFKQNLAYGKNEQTLDLYLPEGVDLTQPRPVVVFVYGGAWSSGNKKMYGMLCSEIAKTLKCLVCCPNYATYPQVHVMWNENIDMYVIIKLDYFMPLDGILGHLFIGLFGNLWHKHFNFFIQSFLTMAGKTFIF